MSASLFARVERRCASPLASPCACGLLLAILLFGAAGCGTARPVKYYRITYPIEAPPPASDALDVGLQVRPFESSHLFLDDKIVYCLTGPEMGAYENHRWAEPPIEILQTSLVRGLRASGRFQAVFTPRSNMNSRFLLSGHLYDFEEVDANPMVARLNYEVRLRDRRTGAALWSHLYSHDEPASGKSLSDFVIAMNKNLDRSVKEVQSGLEEYFRNHPSE